jgi:hypothetical protein
MVRTNLVKLGFEYTAPTPGWRQIGGQVRIA